MQGALVREPGRLLLTDERLYFQPLHPISGDATVRSHPLAGVAAAARRRASLRDLALEVFFAAPGQDGEGEAAAAAASPPHWGGASALLAFASRAEREQAVGALRRLPALGAALPGGAPAAAAACELLEGDPSWLSRVAAAWQRGQLSNLSYLLFLNLAAGRSFCDLSQVRGRQGRCTRAALACLRACSTGASADRQRAAGAAAPTLQGVHLRITHPPPTCPPTCSTRSCPGCSPTTSPQHWTSAAPPPSAT